MPETGHPVRHLLGDLVQSAVLLAVALKRGKQRVANRKQPPQGPSHDVAGDVLPVGVQDLNGRSSVRIGRISRSEVGGLQGILVAPDHQGRLSAQQERNASVAFEAGCNAG